MTKPKFCPHCGESTGAQPGRFCMSCGKPLSSAPGPATEQAMTPAPAPQPRPRRPQRVSQPATTRRPFLRRFRLFAPTTLFGIFDVIALIVAAIVLGITRIQPPSSTCQPLSPPEDARVADSRDVVSGKLSGFLILQAGQTYDLTGNVTVPEEATLQIEPGVRLHFDRDARLDIHGMIHACGNRANPIIFTSERDGKTSGPGAQPGDWQGLRFLATSSDSSILNHVQIRFAGSNGHPAIYLDQASPTLADLRITDSALYPISADVTSEPKLSGDLTLDNNAVKGMEVRGGELHGNTTWEGGEIVRVISGDITVRDGGRLTIKPGVVLKFGDNLGLDVEGTLIAVGGRGAPSLNDGKSIVFTGLRDDAVAGDTDLRTAEPDQGDWRGITFRESNRNTSLRKAFVRYAGRDGRAAIHLESADPELSDIAVEHSAGYAISSDAMSSPEIGSLILKDNALGSGWEIRGGTLSERVTYRWRATPGLVRVVSGNLTVGQEATLVLEEGIQVRFAPDTGLTVEGALEIVGSQDRVVVLSSLRDDAKDAGGDVDGSAAAAAPGDWRGVSFGHQSNDRRSAVRHVLIRYAENGLRFDSVGPAVENVTVEQSSEYPLHCEGNARPTFTNITLFDNTESATCDIP